jgi:hypothetical protein
MHSAPPSIQYLPKSSMKRREQIWQGFGAAIARNA